MNVVWLNSFPNLKDDTSFSITSKPTSNYNCIAWAAFWDDRVVWPRCGRLELKNYFYWPDDIPDTADLNSFVKLFESFDYSVSDFNTNLEEGFRKIALYRNTKTGLCTHASRQLRNGMWTSKLGPQEDIRHSDPFVLEGPDYGIVAIIMKKSNI